MGKLQFEPVELVAGVRGFRRRKLAGLDRDFEAKLKGLVSCPTVAGAERAGERGCYTECRPCFSVPLLPTTADTNKSSFGAISANDLEKLQVLDHSNSGTVYKVNYKRTSTTYALKLVHSDSNNSTVCHQLFREMEILRHTDFPYVVRCHTIFKKSSGDIGILIEYMDSGILETLLKAQGTFSEPNLAHVARQVLKGLNYLYTNKIIHRNIKPANVLVNSNMEVKIANFGVSKILCMTSDPCNSYVGTCAYMSPGKI
ncbi:hypothetical protein L3X38_001561 [Prunus dulcis]|uniref:mitogen-activated protein kinase kinase n=1 Tax=Prunus dulcis TaxID=3755 RepID=A0AAD4WSC3_PRUDU|nr:hypothetical protein L3X38_001561 [Prunus dulcis]